MKVYPRHQLDIRPSDLGAGLVSYCMPLNKRQLEKDILSLWNNNRVKVSFTVRTALDAILAALSLPKGSEVLMSAINIKDMVDIVEAHGLKVKGIDLCIDDLSITPESLENLISPKTRVVIVAQLFGIIMDLKSVYALCQKHNILLIEDCAQAFCGTTYYGSPFADISLFSFGPIKSSTSLGGAIISAKSDKYLNDMRLIENNYPTKGEFWFFKRLLKYSAFKILSIPKIYGLFINTLTLFHKDIEKTINGFTRSFSRGKELIAQLRFQPPLHLLFLQRRKLKSNSDSYYTHREQVARSFLNELGNCFIIPGQQAEFNSFWVLPVLTDNPEKLQKRLLKHGFDSTLGKHAQVAISSDSNAQRMIEKVLYLPNITRMSEKSRYRLVSVLRSHKHK